MLAKSRPPWLWIAAPLLVAALVLLIRRCNHNSPRATGGPSAQASSSASATPGETAPTPLNKAEVDTAINTLQNWLEKAALATRDPWELALAVRALGPNYDLQGKSALNALLDNLQVNLSLSEGVPVLQPTTTQRPPGAALLAVLLEAGAPLDQVVISEFPLRVWLDRERKAVKPALTDQEWERRGWLIDALSLGLLNDSDANAAAPPSAKAPPLNKQPPLPKQQLLSLLSDGFAKLDREDVAFRQWAGKGPEGVNAAGAALQRMHQEHRGMYGLEGWGLPLTHSLLRSVAGLNEAEVVDASLEKAAASLVGSLAIRFRFERNMWAQLMRDNPKDALPDFFNYNALMLEAYGWSRLAFSPQGQDSGALADNAVICAGSLLRSLNALGLDATPAAPTRLISPTSNALRALRMTRRLQWPAQGQ